MEWLKKKRCLHDNKKLKHGSPAKPDSDLESDFEHVGEAEDADHEAEGTDHEMGIERQKQIEAEREQNHENKMKKEIEEELRIVKEIRIRKKVEEELRIEEEKMMQIRIKEEMTIEEEKRIKEQSRLEKENEEEIRIRKKIEEEMRTEEEKRIKEQSRLEKEKEEEIRTRKKIEEEMMTEEEKRIKEQMTTKEEKRREEVLQIQKQTAGFQDQDQVQPKEQSPEEQSTEIVDPLEAEARENVMKMPLNALSLMDFELLLNTKPEEDLLTFLVMKLNFTAWEKDKVVSYSAGGGKPHERFVDLLIRMKIEIDEVIDAADEIENEKVAELLRDLRDNHDVQFTNEINPCDAWKLYLPLTLDPRIPLSKKTSWKGLSGTLDRAEIIRDLEVTQEFGGVYSKTQAFLDILDTRGEKVRFLLDIFEENFPSNAPNKTAVADCFKKAVDRKIASERKKLQRQKNKGK